MGCFRKRVNVSEEYCRGYKDETEEELMMYEGEEGKCDD